ncbi:MAG: hypothetical protein IT406_00865 [Candidatus Yanofskybacteria bacterium]|nr:hypothetical protein [Candidatus Yanofskybacteria bacterium]
MTPTTLRTIALCTGAALIATAVFGLCAMTVDAMGSHDMQCGGMALASLLCESTVTQTNLHFITVALALFVGMVVCLAAFHRVAAPLLRPAYQRERFYSHLPMTALRLALARGVLQPKVFSN